jgi:Holliday junction resolvase RusA-like endonuclease
MIIFIPGKPIAQPRQRHRAVSSRGKSWIQNYTPKKSPVNAYKQAIALAAREQIGSTGFSGPVNLEVIFNFKGTKKGVCSYRIERPDIDNLLKSVQDALVDCGILEDDSQIVFLTAKKINGGVPGTLVQIGEI